MRTRFVLCIVLGAVASFILGAIIGSQEWISHPFKFLLAVLAGSAVGSTSTLLALRQL